MSPDHDAEEHAGGLFVSLFTSDAVAGETSDRGWLKALLEAEAALARAEAACGVITAEAGAAVEDACREAASSLDPVELGRQARLGANPVIPLVAAFRGMLPESAAPFVHYGATSQDIIDTALMLVAKRVLSLLSTDLTSAISAATELADRHRDTVQVARTLLQPALPTTFGLRAAGWADGLMEAADRLEELVARLPAQLGGAAGTLASLGAAGGDVRRAFASEIGLACTDIPWHGQRLVVAELGASLAMACGVCAKVARDVLLLSMDEVAEVREPAADGRGQSSSMPHKRNSVLSTIIVANGRRAPGLCATLIGGLDSELDRSPGTWHAEWLSVNELLRAAGGSAHSVAELLAGLEVDTDAMARHVAELSDRLDGDGPDGSEDLGSTPEFIDAVLARHRMRRRRG